MYIDLKPVTRGELAGTLAWHIYGAYSPDSLVESSRHMNPDKPTLFVIAAMKLEAIRAVVKDIRNLFQRAIITYITPIDIVTDVWLIVDRVVLDEVDPAAYNGVPANELWIRLNESRLNVFPVVAPLGAHGCKPYVYANPDNIEMVIEYIRDAPYMMGVINEIA